MKYDGLYCRIGSAQLDGDIYFLLILSSCVFLFIMAILLQLAPDALGAGPLEGGTGLPLAICQRRPFPSFIHSFILFSRLFLSPSGLAKFAGARLVLTECFLLAFHLKLF